MALAEVGNDLVSPPTRQGSWDTTSRTVGMYSATSGFRPTGSGASFYFLRNVLTGQSFLDRWHFFEPFPHFYQATQFAQISLSFSPPLAKLPFAIWDPRAFGRLTSHGQSAFRGRWKGQSDLPGSLLLLRWLQVDHVRLHRSCGPRMPLEGD